MYRRAAFVAAVLRPSNFRAKVWLPDELRIRLDAM